MRGCRWGAVLAVLALVLAGCVGTVSRDEFEAEVASRGGGTYRRLVVDALDQVAEEVGTDDFAITRLHATSSGALVNVTVRDPRRPGNLDTYTIRSGRIREVRPEKVSVTTDLDAESFPVGQFDLDRLDEMVDAALERYDTPGGHVTGLSILARPSEDRTGTVGRIQLSLESDRTDATATFAPDGRLLELALR